MKSTIISAFILMNFITYGFSIGMTYLAYEMDLNWRIIAGVMLVVNTLLSITTWKEEVNPKLILLKTAEKKHYIGTNTKITIEGKEYNWPKDET